MFRKIAEWITGHKRRDDKHPLDYVDAKQERAEQAKVLVPPPAPIIEPEKTVVQPTIVVPAPVPPAPIPVPVPVPKVESSSTEPWPFPVSPPQVKEEVVATTPEKKPRKPRKKKEV